MPCVVKRSAPAEAIKSGPSRRSRPNSPLPQFVPPQLSQLVENPPSGPQWVHEIKLDGFRMAARIDNGRVQLLTRTGLDWTAKYPGAVAAIANLNVKTAYIDGEVCGVDDAGLPSFARTQAATDGERGVLVYYAFDLLHIGGWDVSNLELLKRKELLEPLVRNKPGLQFNGHETGDGELILQDAGKLGFEGVVSKTIDGALRAGEPAPVAQSQSARSARIRRRRLVGSGRIATASWGFAARLLHRRRQAHLCRPRGHGDAGQGARPSAAPP
jgi:bifunctional non-homologous end joining protein LigD